MANTEETWTFAGTPTACSLSEQDLRAQVSFCRKMLAECVLHGTRDTSDFYANRIQRACRLFLNDKAQNLPNRNIFEEENHDVVPDTTLGYAFSKLSNPEGPTFAQWKKLRAKRWLLQAKPKIQARKVCPEVRKEASPSTFLLVMFLVYLFAGWSLFCYELSSLKHSQRMATPQYCHFPKKAFTNQVPPSPGRSIAANKITFEPDEEWLSVSADMSSHCKNLAEKRPLRADGNLKYFACIRHNHAVRRIQRRSKHKHGSRNSNSKS